MGGDRVGGLEFSGGFKFLGGFFEVAADHVVVAEKEARIGGVGFAFAVIFERIELAQISFLRVVEGDHRRPVPAGSAGEDRVEHACCFREFAEGEKDECAVFVERAIAGSFGNRLVGRFEGDEVVALLEGRLRFGDERFGFLSDPCRFIIRLRCGFCSDHSDRFLIGHDLAIDDRDRLDRVGVAIALIAAIVD